MSEIQIFGGSAVPESELVAITQASRFSPKHAVEYLLYIANRVKTPTIHELLKIRYFADKLHLSAYGVTASGDDYVAMKFGPVGSHTYDLLKAARGERSNFIPADFYAAVANALQVVDEVAKPLRDAVVDELTEADVECLNDAISTYGNMDFEARTHISHDTAWEKGWKEAQRNKAQRGEMKFLDIVHTLENADDVLEYISA
jgi:uncharacterized phage-associated protein